jgi:VCBS repeat-containing protein
LNQSIPQTFTIIPTEVNDAPIISVVNLVQHDEDGEGDVLPRTIITSFQAGPATALDELGLIPGKPGQTPEYYYSFLNPLDPNDDPANPEHDPDYANKMADLFNVQPSIAVNGALTYDLKPHVNTFLLPGDAIVLRVWAQDRDATDPLFNSQRSAFHNLTIRVNDINDAPEFSIPNTSITVLEDNESVTGVTPTVFFNFAIGVRPGPVIDPDRVDDEKLQTPLAFQVELVSSSTPLNGLPTITHLANTESATLSFVTAPDRNGTATFRTRLRDSRFGNPAFPGIGESQWVTFAINVQPVNDAPQFSLSKTREVSEEDKGLIEVRDFATGISPGPANESAQAPDLEFVLRFVNPANPNDLTYADRAAALFDVQPNISSDGILRYRAKKDVNTGAFSSLGRDPLVEVLLTDKGPSTFPNQNNSKQTFTLSITPVNDSPTPRRNYNIDINEDTRATILPTDITLQPNPDPDGTRATPGPEDEVREGQVLRVTNVNQNTEAGGTFVPTIDPLTTQITGWTYTPPLNFVGQDLITYIISDSGSPNASAAGTITVTISPVNDPPEFSINTNTGNPTMDSAGNITVNEDAAPYTIQWARNIVVGPPSARDEINGIPPSVPPQSMLPFDVRVVNTKAVGMFSSLPAIDKNGVLTFTLATDANGLDPFEDAIVEVMAVDNGRAPNPNDPNDRNRNKSAPVTFTIKVNPVNDAPYFEIRKANVVTAEKPAGSSTPVVEPDVLRNIFPAFGLTESPQRARDEATQTVSFTTTKIDYLDNPSLFTVAPTVSSNGTLTFTPRPNQNGRAIVFVRAVDSGAMTPPNINTSAEQSFTITISPVNDKPVAVDDPASNLQYSTTERFAVPNSTVLNITDPSKGLLINDFDLDGNSFEVDTGILSTYTVNTTKGGRVTVNKNGTFTYNPTPNQGSELRRLFEGATTTDTFTYRIKDGSPDGLLSDPATVFITVIGSNDAPEAKPDQFTIPVNTPTLLNVLVNANPLLSDDPIDNPIDVRTVVIGSLPDPAKGTAEPQPDGRIRYTPKPGFRGVDTFTYRVADVSGKVSNEATVTVRVNTAPVAVDDPAVVEMNLAGRVPVATIIDVLENDYDPDLGGSIVQSTLEIVAPSVNGTATVVVDPQNPQKRMIEFIPQTGFEGVTTLEYVVSDNDGTLSNRGTVTIRVIKSFFQNIDNKFDVNDDGFVSPIDVLLVINLLNGVGAPDGWQGTTAGLPGPPNYVDVDGDRFITPLDVIQVINAINNPGNGGAGEGESGAQNQIAPSDLIWSLDAVRLTVENEPNRSYPYERACSALEYGPQPLGSVNRSASNLSLANYLVSLSDEDEEESIEQALSLEHLARSRDAVDDAFADLFGE